MTPLFDIVRIVIYAGYDDAHLLHVLCLCRHGIHKYIIHIWIADLYMYISDCYVIMHIFDLHTS